MRESVGKTTKCAVFSKECVYVTGAFGDLAVSDGDDEDEDSEDDDEEVMRVMCVEDEWEGGSKRFEEHAPIATQQQQHAR